VLELFTFTKLVPKGYYFEGLELCPLFNFTSMHNGEYQVFIKGCSCFSTNCHVISKEYLAKMFYIN
jgi:hypothetical protein